MHLPLARGGGRGVGLPADRRAARPDPDAPDARYRPLVSGRSSCRRARAWSTRSRSGAASSTSASTIRSTRSGRTGRSARRPWPSGPATRRRTGRSRTPTPGRASCVISCVRSKALGRDAHVTLYLPARFRPTASYPLLVVHDGGDFLQYASMKTVLDNLIHRLDVDEMVVAFTHPGERLVEYANSAGALPVPHAGAAAGTGGLAPAGRAARRAVPAGLVVRWRSRRCRRRTGRPTRTGPWC